MFERLFRGECKVLPRNSVEKKGALDFYESPEELYSETSRNLEGEENKIEAEEEFLKTIFANLTFYVKISNMKVYKK